MTDEKVTHDDINDTICNTFIHILFRVHDRVNTL